MFMKQRKNNKRPVALSLEIGLQAAKLVTKLPELINSLQSLSFKIYSPSKTLEERLAASSNEMLRCVFEKAEEIRGKTEGRLPYWESILVAASETSSNHLFLKEAVKHKVKFEASERFELTVDDLKNGLLDEKIRVLDQHEVIALCSKCKLTNGMQVHIPMMDFRIEPSTTNLQNIKVALKTIEEKRGAILESGKSYHYIGFTLMKENEWLKFLARCLLLAPFTDSRYIAHRILEGLGSLRINAGTLKPVTPFTVDYL
jgi:hypothetical protein